jgi:putative endonuclease
MRRHSYFVYILTNCSRHPLYVGMSNSAATRHWQHSNPVPWEVSYTARYRLDRLVYLEHFQYVNNAIDREKQLKRWSRAKKIKLIESVNPKWNDLSRQWQGLPVSIEEHVQNSKPRSLDCASLRSG